MVQEGLSVKAQSMALPSEALSWDHPKDTGGLARWQQERQACRGGDHF